MSAESEKVETNAENVVEDQGAKESTETADATKADNVAEDQGGKESTASADETKPVSAPSPAERIKVDFYQTESEVIINVLAKGIKKEDVNVEYETEKIILKFAMQTGETYERTLNLFKEINPEGCSMKVMSTKIELRVKKVDATFWKTLEAAAAPKETAPTYPSSSKIKKDWAKIDKELSKEKDEDQDVNSLFSKIFASGDDNTKKAMIKSMQESGGTVLSTNWEEVGKKKVEISPPDGMEYKKWDA